jgi:capsular exopolysaccharide synthesis family protein
MFLLSQTPGCKVITVSSPKSSDGKTTNAVNLSIAFSQLGKRVLLIDCDLRRPTVAKKLRLEETDGVSGVLAGFSPISESIISINTCFDVLPAGITPPNPSELLASPSLDKLFETLKMVYDFIIIDTPPMGIVSDALVIAPKTDGLLLVVKEKVTLHSDLEKILDSIKLAGVRTLGAILNGASSQETYSHYKNVY